MVFWRGVRPAQFGSSRIPPLLPPPPSQRTVPGRRLAPWPQIRAAKPFFPAALSTAAKALLRGLLERVAARRLGYFSANQVRRRRPAPSLAPLPSLGRPRC